MKELSFYQGKRWITDPSVVKCIACDNLKIKSSLPTYFSCIFPSGKSIFNQADVHKNLFAS